ncbi:MAG: aminotransferase class III-fold pyridoxal phosphate-dependent enzyme [Candidatus Kapabacteria bacterium]|nr:aminotransferase class III-fold pyridoxal phosphate-dependent enzyme [Candidatus Kapabacteria bacterium]
MHPLPVYALLNIELARGRGSIVEDVHGTQYLDLYGGHAVISIGHSHPHYVAVVGSQLQTLGFYSNSVRIPIQERAAALVGEASGYDDYRFFMVNSGAEANENAIKLASFITGRKRVVAFRGAFHGRTALAVATTDNPRIVAPVNETPHVVFVDFVDLQAVEQELAQGDVAAVIIEGIQGVGGIQVPADDALRGLDTLCSRYGTMLILDEVQSGVGRTGRFFAHQHAGIRPPLITVAKGIGNGFPVGGLLVHPGLGVREGMLGTTFGGNHLASAAVVAVMETLMAEGLQEQAAAAGTRMMEALRDIPGVLEVRGRGLMIGIDTAQPSSAIRSALVEHHRILTGNASTPATVRLLPPLNIRPEDLDRAASALRTLCTVEHS